MASTTEIRPIGGLNSTSPTGEKLSFPLKHTEVFGKITGNLSRVEVRQTFENPFSQTLEAVYVFPLPDEAAVDEMEIHIGDRIIKGSIKKRQEAKEIYEKAKQEGKTAGLLEQERDNIFTQSLANIKPGESIDVVIRYSDSLKFEGGKYEFVFPMVVGPRFIPGQPIGDGDTDQVTDASRITPPVLPPSVRSGHDINVKVEIDGGLPLQEINSPSHRIKISLNGHIAQVELDHSDTIPNKDLILKYQVSGGNTQSTLLKQKDDRGTHFALYFIPAIEYKTNQIVPKDVIFLMDTSGSQQGNPLTQCKALMEQFINGLNPDDTFTIIDFASITTQLSPYPLQNNPTNRQKAIQYINNLQANGGTYLMLGIQAVINYPPASEGRLRSIVLLTDGFIGNEEEIFGEIQQKLQRGNRLYSFGVGSSVNRYLLNRIAELGRGTSQIVRYDEDAKSIADKFFHQINNPVLTNIEIEWQGDTEKPLIYPSILPDLFAEQPLVIFGRFSSDKGGILQIKGMEAGGKSFEQMFNLDDIIPQNNPAIAQLWGRMKIKDLSKTMFKFETSEGVEEITQTALTYQLLSKYTAFVAVSDDDVTVDPHQQPLTMNIPLEIPEGMSYQGVFGGGNVVSAMAMPRMARPTSVAPSGFNFLSKETDSDPMARDEETYATGMEVSPSSPLKKREKSIINKGVELLRDTFFSHQQIRIISITGLAQNEIDLLRQHLQNVQLSGNIQGKLTFEFTIENGRLKNIFVKEKESTIEDIDTINLIKKSLVNWRSSTVKITDVTLTLEIKKS
jgi:Ca-activated chloride channel homolog